MTRPLHLTVIQAVAGIAFTAIAALTSFDVNAGEQRPCDDPRVFQGAAVNSFVLPYRYVGLQGNRELELASRQIAALVHLELLFSMLKYGRVGGTDLLARKGEVCDVDHVIAKVSMGTGSGALLPGQTLVVVWGRLFDQGDQLYLQSYVRFLRQGDKGPVSETISVDLEGEGLKLPLRAALPAQSLAFPPRRISKEDLKAVSAEFRKSMTVRQKPALDAPGKSIDFPPDRAFPYYVTKTQTSKEGDWMWIEPITGGPAGWVRARGVDNTPERWSLQRWLPELAYVDAIHGFMRLRAQSGEALKGEMQRNIERWIEEDFALFQKAVRDEDGPTAYGLALALRGFTTWQVDNNAAGRSAAARLFSDARRFMPELAAARNLEAVTRPIATGAKIDADALEEMRRALVGAVALDPRNSFALANLELLYQTMSSRPGLRVLEVQDLEQQMAVVKAARSK